MKILVSLYLTLDVDLVRPDQRDNRDEVIDWTTHALYELEDELGGRLLGVAPASTYPGFDPQAHVQAAAVNVASVMPLRDILFPGWTHDYPADPVAEGWQMQPVIQSLLLEHPAGVTQPDPEG